MKAFANRLCMLWYGMLLVAWAFPSAADSQSISFGRDAGMAPVPSGELYYEAAGSGHPVILIHGNAGDLRHWDVTAEHDIPANQEIADLLEQTIAGARRVTMRGTGHLMHMERSEEFNELVLEFLSTVREG